MSFDPDVETPDAAVLAAEAQASGWRQDKQGRLYTPRRGASGIVYRQGNETLEEAHARDGRDRDRPKDKPPGGGKRKPPQAAKAPAPTQTDLKELEFLLCEALKSPATICIAVGDQWPAEHLMAQAPVFARNLTHAAQHNPWLRRKLEAMVTGEDLMIKLVTTASVFGAGFMYLAPVLLYYTDPGFVPAQVKGMLEVPNRAEERAKLAAMFEEQAHAAEAAQAADAAARNGQGAPAAQAA